MKKKEIKIQQTKKKKRQHLSFEQRFKNRKSIVGKLGLLELLGIHQPFNNHNQQQTTEMVNSQINNQIQKRRINHLQVAKGSLNNSKFASNKTQKIMNNKKITKKRGSQLPNISKSSSHIQMVDYLVKQDLSTRQYWKGKIAPPIIKNRSKSQLSCINMVRNDLQANQHWKNLEKMQILNRINNKNSLKLKLGQQ